MSSWRTLLFWPVGLFIVQDQHLAYFIILIAVKNMWVKGPALWHHLFGCWQLLGANAGLETLLQVGNGVFLSLFVLHKVQLCGGWKSVAFLTRAIVHEVKKHSAANIVGWNYFSLVRFQTKIDDPAWDTLYNYNCHCYTRNCMYWLKSPNRREGNELMKFKIYLFQ